MLSARLLADTANDDPLYVGAVKANIGHLEGCSGLAGLIKTILVLETGWIPLIAGFEIPNSRIDAEALCLHVSQREPRVVFDDTDCDSS